ncbi:uncharacterized protein LOC106158598 [Lingula anatina]|uniref:Uncharacterized protein LOC106158598 n=1 Tax=Lingula anatina TaxID=7574 RepID=A0A1S3HVP6_LINAN|nr:uncharacterized protein LOC106158598 [Lingula anatina]|eukprot:XP_013390110.1 uncharacterized protein LOC106158598 [Lingula anatina]
MSFRRCTVLSNQGFTWLMLILLFVALKRMIQQPGQSTERIHSHQLASNDNPSYDIAVFREIGSREANHLDLTDPGLLGYVRRKWLYAPPPGRLGELNLTDTSKIHYSQWGQSQIVDAILRGRRGGFYVECGAWDGETNSNSLFFEKSRNWTGLLVEPDPLNFEKLSRKHRNAYLSPTCITARPTKVDFQFSKTSDAGSINPLTKKKVIGKNRMLCLPIASLLLSIGQTHVDYFSLDVESIELEILREFPWDKITVDVWTIEVHRYLPNYDATMNEIKQIFNRTGLYGKGKEIVMDIMFVRRDANTVKEIKRSK